MTRRAIGVSERPPLLQTIPLSLQHLFAMFGATVLVPVLFHINPATVLLFNGIGTLLYLFICKGKIPAYLGSSFAFISPVLLLLPLGYEVALGGFIMCGVLFCLRLRHTESGSATECEVIRCGAGCSPAVWWSASWLDI